MQDLVVILESLASLDSILIDATYDYLELRRESVIRYKWREPIKTLLASEKAILTNSHF